MRLQKKDFQIVFQNHDRYTVQVRKPFFKYFYRWVTVTYQETENSEEQVMEFESFEAATKFIDLVAN